MSKQSSQEFNWAVIGAGPGGITAVGLLLDQNIPAKDILWIDPYFQAGDFGRFWGEVNSNTRVGLFRQYLEGVSSFNYRKQSTPFVFDTLSDEQFTLLKHVAEPLLWISDHLKKQVNAQQALVKSLHLNFGSWEITTTDQACYRAQQVILAMGAEPTCLNYPDLQSIDLITALTPSRLKRICQPTDCVAVFGSSHSAMIIIRNLVELGVQKIVNFYLSPLRFAVLMDDWIFYDDSGLKGETAAWVKENILRKPLPQIERYLNNQDHIKTYLPGCNKAIYAVGFQTRDIPIDGASLKDYDQTNGIIAPGLFGVGIGFPIAVIDPFGRKEFNIGLWKFLKNMQRALPIWQRYTL